VSFTGLSTCQIFINDVAYTESTTCRALVCPRVRFLLTTWPIPNLPRAEQSLHQKNDFRSTLLHKMTTYIIILNLNQITAVQISSKPLTEFTYQATTQVHINIANKPHICSLNAEAPSWWLYGLVANDDKVELLGELATNNGACQGRWLVCGHFSRPCRH
jgi:hypothetical protein